MAEWLGYGTCNPEVTGSSPTLTTKLESSVDPTVHVVQLLGHVSKIIANWSASCQLEFLTMFVIISIGPEKPH